MGDMEFLTESLADKIENKQFLSGHVKKLSLLGDSSAVLNRILRQPTSFIFNVERPREVVRESSSLLLGKRTRIWNIDDAWNVLDHQKVRAQCIHESIVIMRIF